MFVSLLRLSLLCFNKDYFAMNALLYFTLYCTLISVGWMLVNDLNLVDKNLMNYLAKNQLLFFFTVVLNTVLCSITFLTLFLNFYYFFISNIIIIIISIIIIDLFIYFIYLFAFILEFLFVLQWLSLHWEIMIIWLSQVPFIFKLKNRMPHFIA